MKMKALLIAVLVTSAEAASAQTGFLDLTDILRCSYASDHAEIGKIIVNSTRKAAQFTDWGKVTDWGKEKNQLGPFNMKKKSEGHFEIYFVHADKTKLINLDYQKGYERWVGSGMSGKKVKIPDHYLYTSKFIDRKARTNDKIECIKEREERSLPITRKSVGLSPAYEMVYGGKIWWKD